MTSAKLKVVHDLEDVIQEGETILTLKDRPLLDHQGNLVDEDEEIFGNELENIELQDAKKCAKSNKLKSQKGKCTYTQVEDSDDEVVPTKPSILPQYDEWEREQEELLGLRIESKGFYIKDTDSGYAIEGQAAEKKNKSRPGYTYYGQDETTEAPLLDTNIKARKKVAKKSHSVKNNDDPIDAGFWKDLFDGASSNQTTIDMENAEKKRIEKKVNQRLNEIDPNKEDTKPKSALEFKKIQLSNITYDNDEQSGIILPAREINPVNPDDDEDEDALLLTTTTEFCRTVQTPLEKLADMSSSNIEESTEEETKKHRRNDSTKESKRSKHDSKSSSKHKLDSRLVVSSNNKSSSSKLTSMEDGEELDTEAALEGIQEQPIGSGLCSALQYLKGRGELEAAKVAPGQFVKKPDYRPLHTSTVAGDIKLEYKDEFGNVMTPKEAFQKMSWIFHGKGPGRKKMEKRLKKMEIDKAVMSGPVENMPTFRALKRTQEADGKPFMLLTGGSGK